MGRHALAHTRLVNTQLAKAKKGNQMKQSRHRSLYLAAILSGVSFSAKAEEKIDLNQTLVQALKTKEAEILSALGLTGQGHTIDSIAYADTQGYGAGNMQYPDGFKVTPTPVFTLEQWSAVCSPSRGQNNASSTQSIQEGHTYNNTQTTNQSIVVTVDASAKYGMASLDVNAVTSFDTSETTTTTATQSNTKSVTINLSQEKLFTCRDDGPFYMKAVGVVSNNLVETPAGSTNVPYTYDVYPAGNSFTVTTQSPLVTKQVAGASVRVMMYNKNDILVWDTTDPANPGNPNNHQYYRGNSPSFPVDKDIRRVVVSTGTNYGVTAMVWICRDGGVCLEMGRDQNQISADSPFARGGITSLIVKNQDVTTEQTGGTKTDHTLNISDFLGLQYTIATLGGTYTATAIDNISSVNQTYVYPYDPAIVPGQYLYQCGTTLEAAQEQYRLTCNK